MEKSDERFVFNISKENIKKLKRIAPTLLEQLCHSGYEEKDSYIKFFNQPGHAKVSAAYFLSKAKGKDNET